MGSQRASVTGQGSLKNGYDYRALQRQSMLGLTWSLMKQCSSCAGLKWPSVGSQSTIVGRRGAEMFAWNGNHSPLHSMCPMLMLFQHRILWCFFAMTIHPAYNIRHCTKQSCTASTDTHAGMVCRAAQSFYLSAS